MPDWLRVTVANGKYTVIQQEKGNLYFLRYGEDWDALNQNDTFKSSDFVLALALEIKELREQLDKYKTPSKRISSKWQDISTAPKDIYIDILGKFWNHRTDTFQFQRFPSMRWRQAFDNIPAGFGMPEPWRAVAWMHIPAIPKNWPLNDA
ncbi:MAG TPA: hypothetical protein VFV16_06620 [Candidatus Nitrosotalea sp.]|nr:hypothetical protein [Candidatus Nitrosotalea sp.]